MYQKVGFILALILSSSIQGAELERSTITSCAYQAGTAREIQVVRQEEGDDWSQFEQKVMGIYKDGQGRSDLLVIAKEVYLQPVNTATSEVYDQIFRACVKLTEEMAELDK